MFGAEEVNRCAFNGVSLLFPSELMAELKLFILDIKFVFCFGDTPVKTTAPLPPLLVLITLLPYNDYSI